MIRIRPENNNTVAEWDSIYGGDNAYRWTVWHDDHLVKLFSDFIPRKAHVAHLGAGAGWAGRKIRESGRRDIKWAGFDHSPAAIGRMAEFGVYEELGCFDLDTFPWPIMDGSYDVAMCVEVLEHLENPIMAILEMKRISKRIAVTVPDQNSVDTKYHVWSIGREDLELWLPGARIEPARDGTLLCAFWEGQ
jgi:SAM-dependent methyltransferase